MSIHSQVQQLAPNDRVEVLYQLSIAATGADSELSDRWAVEMFEVATHDMPQAQKWEQMQRAAQRKNALTVLSFSNPEAAAQRFFELEPDAAHLPNEDPRVDCSRHLFPRLWAKEGRRSLPLMRRMAQFTATSGEYPYAAMGLLLPEVAKTDRAAAREIFSEAVREMAKANRIHRTYEAYIRFLHGGWQVATKKQQRDAVLAGIEGAEHLAHDFDISPGAHSYFEYYLADGTVRLNSETDARIFDLLPFADAADRALGQDLRQRYRNLQGLRVPSAQNAPWRTGVFATADHDTPDRIERAFELGRLTFLDTWAKQDAVRAAGIAQTAKNLSLRRAALAIVLPHYMQINADVAERWRTELQNSGEESLLFQVAMTRADFRMGHSDDARKLAQLVRFNGIDKTELETLADIYGQFDFGNASFAEALNGVENPLRLLLQARYARGASRDMPGYSEPT